MARVKGLTVTEARVANLVATGMRNKEVAQKLFVCEKTVKFHMTNIMRKLDISRRGQLILMWAREEAAKAAPPPPPEVTANTVLPTGPKTNAA